MTETLTTGREYLRVSQDRSGRQKSNDEQHDDNVAAGPGFGIDRLVAKPYRDTGSASRYARKTRDDFPRLLDDLSAGRFGADVLILWESSHGSRKVSEWCQLIEACEAASVRIAVTTHARVYNPANARDRRSLIEDANDSEYESAKTSQRTRRDTAAAAVAGQPHGKTPFGYRREFDPKSGRFLRQVPDPDEAPIVVEMYQRVAAGHSLKGLSDDLAARGVVSKNGVPFHPQTIRWMLLAPLYRGKRVHFPGTSAQRMKATEEHLHDAAWDPLVADELFFAVDARLRDPARKTARPGRGKHLLSMIATCDACGGPLSATYRHRGKRRYQCHKGAHLLIDADQLDAWAEHDVLGFLADSDRLEQLMPQAAHPAALDAARDEVARVRAEHQDLEVELAAGRMTAKLAAGAEPGILARLSAAETRVQELVTPAGLRQLIRPGPKAREQWKVMPMEAKREVVRLLFVPGVLGTLSIARAEKGKWSQARSRVRLDGKPLDTLVTTVV